MEELIKKLKTDEAFANDFKAFVKNANGTVKEGCSKIGAELNKFVIKTITDFAKSKGMSLKDNETVKKQLSTLSKQICIQLDEMIVKQFKALDLTQNSKQ